MYLQTQHFYILVSNGTNIVLHVKEKYNLTEKLFSKLQKSFKFKPERQIVVCIIALLPKSKQNVNVRTEMQLETKKTIAKTNTPCTFNEVCVIYLRFRMHFVKK